MTKVKALQTVAGDYGVKYAGEEFEVTDKLANDLIHRGLVEAVGESDGKEPEAKNISEKSSVTISDNTNKEKKNILKPGKSE